MPLDSKHAFVRESRLARILSGRRKDYTDKMAVNRLQIIEWREHGADEDTLEMYVLGADQPDITKSDIRKKYDIEVEGDPDAEDWEEPYDGSPGTIYCPNEIEITDGQELAGENGRKFRIRIEEVTE